MFIHVSECVGVHVMTDKCLPRHWPKETELKLCHLVLQPGIDQSAFSTRPPTIIPTHTLTDRPGLCAVSPWSPDGLCEAAMLEATGSSVTCWIRYFFIQSRIWCHPPISVYFKNPLKRNWLHVFISMQQRHQALN